MGDLIKSTVLAGWLGSGKTTLLNELLGSIKTERIAVIVNDVGDVNIDAALIASVGGDRIELTDGCICCSIGSSLALTLRDLVLVDNPPDRIIIEASGIAEPANVGAYGDRRLIELPTIVVTVDASDVLERSNDLRYGPLVRAQVEQADALVLTKADVASDARRSDVIDWLGQLAPQTPVIPREHALIARPASRGPDQSQASTHDGSAPVETRTVDYASEVVDLVALHAELTSDQNLLRAKGILRTSNGSHVLVNFAANSFSSVDYLDPVDPAVINCLVLISRVT